MSIFTAWLPLGVPAAPSPHRGRLQASQATLGMAQRAHRPAPSSLGLRPGPGLTPAAHCSGFQEPPPAPGILVEPGAGALGVAGPNEQGVPPGVVRKGWQLWAGPHPRPDGRAGLHNTHLC